MPDKKKSEIIVRTPILIGLIIASFSTTTVQGQPGGIAAEFVEREIFASGIPGIDDKFEETAVALSEVATQAGNTWKLTVGDVNMLDGVRFSIKHDNRETFFQLDSNNSLSGNDHRINISQARTAAKVAAIIRGVVESKLPARTLTKVTTGKWDANGNWIDNTDGNTVRMLLVDASVRVSTKLTLRVEVKVLDQTRRELLAKLNELKLDVDERTKWNALIGSAIREIKNDVKEQEAGDEDIVHGLLLDLGNGMQKSVVRHARNMEILRQRLPASAGTGSVGSFLIGKLPWLHSKTKNRSILGLIKLSPQKDSSHGSAGPQNENRSKRWSILGIGSVR